METGRHCAYNVTRNALLSERVWCVDEFLGEAELLELVMNGPGIDRHSGVWVGRSPGWIDLPRLFAFDFVYLDEERRIVESGGVGPGAGFPPIGEGVAGALILGSRRLAETGATAGDQLRICAQAEVAALVKAASPSPVQAESARSAASIPPASLTAFEVSRYSEFVFEPFGGSLVYLPQAETPLPQSTEYFLPDQRKAAAENVASAEPAGAVEQEAVDLPVMDAADKSAEILESRGKRTKKKAGTGAQAGPEQTPPQAPTPQEEPHFYTPKPIRFFDPAAATDKQESPPRDEPEEIRARPATQLPPELKAAIKQIDEQLRREREELENRGKESRPKDRKRKPAKKMAAKTGEPAPVKPAHPAWEELAETSGSMIKLEPEAIETPTEMIADSDEEIATPVEEQIEPAPPVAALEAALESGESEAEIAATKPLSAAGPVAEKMSPPESATPLEETRLSAKIAPTAPTEPEVIVLAPVAASEPRTALPVQEPVRETPREIAEPEATPVKKPKRRKEGPTLGERLHRWIGTETSRIADRRRGERVALTGLVAFYWSGGAPRPHEIVNISKSGFYLRTKELWLPDTLVRMTLQRNPRPDGQQEVEGSGSESIGVLARVVRIDEEGVGHEFVTTEALRNVRTRDVLPQDGTNSKELERFLKSRE